MALLPSIERVVVIESTWQKGGAVYSDPALGLSLLPAVHLDPSLESTYWRYQELGRQFLCTLEAIYHLSRELLALQPERAEAMQGTQLDDLLYLYAHMHRRIHRRYGEQRLPGEGGGDGEGGAATGSLTPAWPPRRYKAAASSVEAQRPFAALPAAALPAHSACTRG